MKLAGQSPKALTLILLLICPLLAQAEEDVLYTAEYEGKHSGMTVKTTRSLVRTDNNNYYFVSRAKSLFASIDEVSRFKFENGEVIPESYQYKRNIFGAKKEETINFDWKNNTATYEREGRPEKKGVHKAYIGLLDPSLYQLELQRDLLKGKTKLSYDFVRDQRIKHYDFKVEGTEELDIGGKTYQAVRVERVNDGDKKTVIWLIPAFHYQMGKIRHVDEDGDEYEMRMTSYASHPELFGELLQQSAQMPGGALSQPAE